MESAPNQLLPIQELQGLAEAEAARFTLPADWEDGRTFRHVDAIDTPGAKVRDDAISLSRNDEGSILHVSITEPGTYIHNLLPHSAELAARHGQLIAGRGIIPYRLSRSVFGFSPQGVRPALTFHIPVDNEGLIVREPTITKDAVKINAYNFGQFEDILQSGDERRDEFRDLLQFSRTLFERRTGKRPPPYAYPNFFSPAGRMADFVVRECMIATNASAAKYVDVHDIPVIHLGNASRLNKRPEYIPEPRPNTSTQEEQYAHVTSPLIYFSDLSANANLSAHLNGEPYPYSREFLAGIIPHLNRVAFSNKNGDLLTESSFTPPRVRKLGASAFKLLDKLSQGALENDDLTTIFFGPMNASKNDKDHLREKAVEYVKDRPEFASTVLHTALGNKWLRKEETMGANGRPMTRQFTLVDLEGNRYEYSTRLKGATPAALTIAMLGRVAGMELNPFELTQELHAEARLQRALQDASKYMRILDKKAGLGYVAYAEEGRETELFRARAMVTIDGVQYHRQGYGTNTKNAIQDATAQLIRELDLVENPPKPKAPNRRR